MKRLNLVVTIVFSVLCIRASMAQQEQISSERVAAIEAMIGEDNVGLAPPCSHRAQWQPTRTDFVPAIAQADNLLGEPFPAWSDEAYLDYFRTGSRERGNAMINGRSSWLTPLVLAECATWDGRYLKTLAMVLDELSSQRSWAMPAHDVDQGYITGKRYFVELLSADLANTMASALYLMGDKLPASTRKNVMNALEERVFRPMRASYTSGKGQTWLNVQSNWNAVCLAGVTGAALAVLPDKRDRAFFLAAAEYYQQFYLKSFPEDGFEVEGIGYWNYGFSNYAVLREELWRATSGKLDLFQDKKVQRVARFGVDFQMLPGVLAYFSDAHFGEEPSPALSAYVSRVFHVKNPALPAQGSAPNFAFTLIQHFPSASDLKQVAAAEGEALRTFYPVAGVLVSRPADQKGLAVTVKAMGNGPHSHNDIGSYAIGSGKGQPMGEPGGPAFYNAQTFSKDRFLSKLLNSYGHPVPMIDGQLQKDALTVKAPVVKTLFTDKTDSMAIDMTEAYRVADLKRLVRTVTNDRSGSGTVTITDAYDLGSALKVDEALTTVGTWRKLSETLLEFKEGDATVRVKINCSAPFEIHSETVNEYGRPFQRIGVASTLTGRQEISFVIQPAQ